MQITYNHLNITYFENWLAKQAADEYFIQLKTELAWQQETLKLYGKNIIVPRKVAWYGDKDAIYQYSGVKHQPLPWHPILLKLKEKLKTEFNYQFNSVLANVYGTGKEYMGWHCDNEPELGNNPIIASISLGAKRRFYLRHNKTKEKIKLELAHGSLLIMAGETQNYWQHSLPKMLKVNQARINLTFRWVQQ